MRHSPYRDKHSASCGQSVHNTGHITSVQCSVHDICVRQIMILCGFSGYKMRVSPAEAACGTLCRTSFDKSTTCPADVNWHNPKLTCMQMCMMSHWCISVHQCDQIEASPSQQSGQGLQVKCVPCCRGKRPW